MYSEDEYLLLSGIQHFVFCRRQWALIHIEQEWNENSRTVDGKIMHENAHNSNFNEKRGDTITIRAMEVSSASLGISGECDIVELKKSKNGICIFGHCDKYSVIPVEYKNGEPKENECDIMQLTAQAMCLEEMLCCEIPFGYIYYGRTKHRFKVMFDDGLRKRTIETLSEMHDLYKRKHTPKVKRTKSCNACSLKNICLPVICGKLSASEYVRKTLELGEEQ